ncbi:hypothetical protein AJ79_07945 [Helicocarpus griseus UAMH5409]|uniref:Uncharacterized protein n=1 Tax=Helicocarpus griseus UAMH5409 TaxID=1447875 RepID=A0A2B7WY01_9EURO|nr:hypothetical protein AJ79_07945 [Helicocarpus griseus UAMH5409]
MEQCPDSTLKSTHHSLQQSPAHLTGKLLGFSKISDNQDMRLLLRELPSREHEKLTTASSSALAKQLDSIKPSISHCCKEPDESTCQTSSRQVILGIALALILKAVHSDAGSVLERDARWWLSESRGGNNGGQKRSALL